MISEEKKDFDFILSVFKIKLLCLIGYRPRIRECINCGQKNNLHNFSIKNNGMLCENCYLKDKASIQINNSTLMALNFIMEAPLKKIYNFDLKQNSFKEFELISKVYFSEKLERDYKFLI